MKDINEMTEKELRKEVRNEAKKANTRLRSLETQGMTKSSFAYRKTEDWFDDMKDIMSTDYKGRMKYRTDVSQIPTSKLRRELSKLRGFLYESGTSTPTGVRRVYDKRLQAFNETTGATFTRDEFAEMLQNINVRTLYNTYGSDIFVTTKEYIDKGLSSERVIELFEIAQSKGYGFIQLKRDLDKEVDRLNEQDIMAYEQTID